MCKKRDSVADLKTFSRVCSAFRRGPLLHFPLLHGVLRKFRKYHCTLLYLCEVIPAAFDTLLHTAKQGLDATSPHLILNASLDAIDVAYCKTFVTPYILLEFMKSLVSD